MAVKDKLVSLEVLKTVNDRLTNGKIDKFTLPNNGEMTFTDSDNGALTELVMEGHTIQSIDPPPSPSNPQPIHSVERIDIRTHGKNLYNAMPLCLKPVDFTYGVLSEITDERDDYNKSVIVEVNENTKYSVSCSDWSKLADDVIRIFGTQQRPSTTAKAYRLPNVTSGNNIIDSGDFKYIMFIPRITNVVSDDLPKYLNIQVEEGSVATEYEPYRGYEASIVPPRPLNKIGDYADVCDVEKGAWEYRTGTYKGTASPVANGGSYGWVINVSSLYKPLMEKYYGANGLTMPFYNSIHHYPCEYSTNNSNHWCVSTGGNYVVYTDSNSALQPINMELVYPTNEYTEPISASDLALLKSISTYNPNTIVSITDQDGNDIRSMFHYPISLPDIVEQTEDKLVRTAQTANRADAKADALMQIANGVLYSFQQDSTEKAVKAVPNNGYLADVLSVGGKSVVWNQLAKETTTDNYLGQNGTLEYDTSEKALKITPSAGQSLCVIHTKVQTNYTANHVIYYSYDVKSSAWPQSGYNSFLVLFNAWTSKTVDITKTGWQTVSGFFKTNESRPGQFGIRKYAESTNAPMYFKNFVVVDITQLFGAAIADSLTENSPEIASVAQYAKKHPEYNEGEIVSFGTKEIKVVGKNLIDPKLFLDDKWWSYSPDVSTMGSSSGFSALDYVEIQPNTTYTLKSVCNDNGVAKYKLFDADKKPVAGVRYGDVPQTLTFTTPANAMYIGITTDVGTKNDAILVKGDTIGNFAPYKSTIIPINPAVLALDGYGLSAGDVANTIEQDANGKWWYHKRVEKHTFDGSEAFGTIQSGGDIYVSGFDNLIKKRDYVESMICDRFAVCTNNSFANDTYGVTGYDDYDNRYPNKNYIYFKLPAITTKDAYINAIKGATIYYELATPEVTDITDLMLNYAPMAVKPNGTIEFVTGDVQMPVPSTVEYAVKNV